MDARPIVGRYGETWLARKAERSYRRRRKEKKKKKLERSSVKKEKVDRRREALEARVAPSKGGEANPAHRRGEHVAAHDNSPRYQLRSGNAFAHSGSVFLSMY